MLLLEKRVGEHFHCTLGEIALDINSWLYRAAVYFTRLLSSQATNLVFTSIVNSADNMHPFSSMIIDVGYSIEMHSD
jgi:hypothetical protein